MAGRKKMDPFVKSPKAEVAKSLAEKVFTLRESLGIPYEQMAKEMGMKRPALSALKSAWVNREVGYKFMYLSGANALVKFWNMHLTNNGKVVVRKKAAAPAKEPNEAGKSEDILSMLIEKVGLDKTRELLAVRGKEAELTAYLGKLTPEQLADLV